MPALPRLSRSVLASLRNERGPGFDVPPQGAIGRPEKVLQFGTGVFLRGFAEYFIDQANRRGEFNGSVVAVSSTASDRDALLNEQEGLYTLVVCDLPHEAHHIIGSLSRALSARHEWEAVLAVARDPALELVISNTTEVGIVLDEEDAKDAAPPRSFPGKLTCVLAERATAFDYDPARGLIVLPCELIEANGDALRGMVQTLARRWQLGDRFERWLDEGVRFCNTLVDRIVPGLMPTDDRMRVGQAFGYRDELMTACESYALFVIEGDAALRARLGFAANDPRIVVTPDIRPYRERKVRVLNGAHTIAAPLALLAGCSTVRDAIADERIGRFIRRVVLDEIAPGLDAPGADAFARDVLDRFANPFIRHALIDITLHGTTKMRVRIVPSIVAYGARTNRPPASLALGFAAYLAYMRGELQQARAAAGQSVPADAAGTAVTAAWTSVDRADVGALSKFVRTVCADHSLWAADLSAVPVFVDAVTDGLVRILRDGIVPTLDAHLLETART